MKELPTFKNFIFDLDGTLLDTVPDLVLLTNKVMREVGYPEHSTEEVVSYVGNGVRRLIYQALPSSASEDTVNAAMDIWNENFYDYWEQTFPFDGIVELLNELQDADCKLGVVSNKLQSGVDLIMEKRLPGYFSVLIGEREGIPRKPDPTGIMLAMQLMYADPKDTVYLGDSPGDIVAAHNANLFAVAVLWGYHKQSDFDNHGAGKPDLFVRDPKDLEELIRRIS